jgi:hypothetical protein
MSDTPAEPTRPEAVRADQGAWISGPAITSESVQADDVEPGDRLVYETAWSRSPTSARASIGSHLRMAAVSAWRSAGRRAAPAACCSGRPATCWSALPESRLDQHA